MNFEIALAGQIRASLAMLRECIELCPSEFWNAGKHPRTFWRIAYHALFYTHLYAMPTEDDFTARDKHQRQATILWDDDEDGIPPEEVTYSQADLLEYLNFMDLNMQYWVENVDFSSLSTGFSWYQKPNKLDHMLLNLRHLSIHVGQLQELLYAQNLEPNWVSLPANHLP